MIRNFTSLKKLTFLRVITSPFTIALALTIVTILLFGGYFPKYIAKITKTGIVERQGGLITFYDIDNDRRSEQILSFINEQGKPAFKVTNQDGLVVDQHQYEGDDYPTKFKPAFEDINQNQCPEVIAFIRRGDSLFLSIFEYREKFSKISVQEEFIVRVPNKAGKPNFVISSLCHEDMDNDSLKEIVFTVMAGYPVLPRNVYIFNTKTKLLLSSGFTGAFSYISEIKDINNDGNKEILLNQYAPGNMKVSTINGLNDYAVWLQVYDSQLQCVFDPVKFIGKYSSCLVQGLHSGKGNFIASIVDQNADSLYYHRLLLYDLRGKLVAEHKLAESRARSSFRFLKGKEFDHNIFVVDDKNHLTEYNLKLKQLNRKEIPFSCATNFHMLDIDRDRQQEYIFTDDDAQLITIARTGLKDPVAVKLNFESIRSGISLIENIGKPNELFLQYTQKYFQVSYSKNPYYFLRIPVYFLVFAGFLGFIYLIQFLQHIRMKEKYRTERKIAALQLKLIKKQVDPHFLFNVLNTLSYNIISKEPDKAYSGINRLAKFIRTSVEWGDSISRPLHVEIESVRNYLEMFKTQQKEKFDFEITVGKEIQLDQQVPVMLMQNFVENAVKHGLTNLDRKGLVQIRLIADTHNTYIEIEDNGIGRKAASETASKGTGRGISLMQQFFDLLNKLNDKKSSFIITDLYDENSEPNGTLVKITLPLGIKYSVYD